MAAIVGFSSGRTYAATVPSATEAAPPSPQAGAPPSIPADAKVLTVQNGQERWSTAGAATAAGLTIVDFSDDWTPYIFEEVEDTQGEVMSNRYRSVFLGLANDTGDSDGQPLSSGEHNYLELYGIPPSLSVLRARFLEDEKRTCPGVDWEKLRGSKAIPLRSSHAEKKFAAKLRILAHKLELEQRRAGVDSLEALAQKEPKHAKDVELIERYAAQRISFPEVEKRLACEGLLDEEGKDRHKSGEFDEAMRRAVIRFQAKNKLYDAAALRPDTMTALGRTPLQNDYEALVRVVTERVAASASVLEDGSVDTHRGPPTFTNSRGEKVPVPNLVDEDTKATLQQLGLTSPEAALAFMKRHPAGDFAHLLTAAKLLPLPEYYSSNMDLRVVIDRGDVIYDPLYDENGKPTKQVRHHFPMFMLLVHYNGRDIPLVRWRTTIGGWRSEQASNGYEYFRYKGSDVGPRVWRNIVSGPVWIAPSSTPIRTLVKWSRVHGHSQQVVNYNEIGPGYTSAYGLVAAYNVVPGKNGRPDWDNGIRVHGSSEILSIRNPNAYSHGCHRLMNHLAERLFSFVLRHRPIVVEGDKPMDFSRLFLWKDDVYDLRIPSRGFWYRLEPPLPVTVMEGNIVGTAQKPVQGYFPKPGVEYPPGPPPVPKETLESRAGGDE